MTHEAVLFKVENALMREVFLFKYSLCTGGQGVILILLLVAGIVVHVPWRQRQSYFCEFEVSRTLHKETLSQKTKQNKIKLRKKGMLSVGLKSKKTVLGHSQHIFASTALLGLSCLAGHCYSQVSQLDRNVIASLPCQLA